MWGAEEPEFDDGNDLTGQEGIVFDRFYVIQNDKAIDITEPMSSLWNCIGSVGGRDILVNGVIRLYGGTPDYTSYAYFRYANGELSLLRVLRNFSDTGRWLFTYEGDQSTRTPITEEEFNRMRAEIEGDAQVVEIDWKPLESYGRE